ncbi:type 1 glutamine amidotransferase [Marinomonas epiphytica]
MKIGILAAGTTPDSLLPQYGSYAGMFVDSLAAQNASYSFQIYDVHSGTFPNSIMECDAWLITGSPSNVDERTPWMNKLSDFIREVDADKRALVGICFGHQIIADALGGEVEKFIGGWGVGVHRYQSVAVTKVADKWTQQLPEFSICAMHQYQVVKKPSGAKVFAQSNFCQNAGLVYGQHIVTLQGHPEFSKAYEAELIHALKGESFESDVADQGLRTLNSLELDSPQVITWLSDFISQAHQTRQAYL